MTRKVPLVPSMPASTFQTVRILVADDDAVNRLMAKRMLEKQGHRVETASNGREALAALRSAEFDAVLLDVQMPEMNGFAAAEAIRRMGGRLPAIIGVTGLATSADREACRMAGMDAVLAKPYGFESLRETVARCLPS